MNKLSGYAFVLFAAVSTVHASDYYQAQQEIADIRHMQQAFKDVENYFRTEMATKSKIANASFEPQALIFQIIDDFAEKLMELQQFRAVKGFKEHVKALRNKFAYKADATYATNDFSGENFLGCYFGTFAAVFAAICSHTEYNRIEKYSWETETRQTVYAHNVNNIETACIITCKASLAFIATHLTLYTLATFGQRIATNTKNAQLKELVSALNEQIEQRVQEKIVSTFDLLEAIAE